MQYRNTLKKAVLIQKLVAEHYEPGRQDRCFLAVYRNVVTKVYPMSERTFFRYMMLDTSPLKQHEDKRQLKLEF